MKENSTAEGGSLVPRFFKMLNSMASEEACQIHLGQLDDYITAQLDDQNVMATFPDTAVHLDTCLLCAESYALLYETRTAEQKGQLINPPETPHPDLSFLLPDPNLSNLLSQQLRTRVDTISLHLTERLLVLLRPLPQAAPVRSASGRYKNVLYNLTPEHVPDLDLHFSLTAYKDLQNESMCLVEINVAPPNVYWPDLEGYTVRIEYMDEQLTQKTDDWGTAVLANIPINQLPYLTITIENPI